MANQAEPGKPTNEMMFFFSLIAPATPDIEVVLIHGYFKDRAAVHLAAVTPDGIIPIARMYTAEDLAHVKNSEGLGTEHAEIKPTGSKAMDNDLQAYLDAQNGGTDGNPSGL